MGDPVSSPSDFCGADGAERFHGRSLVVMTELGSFEIALHEAARETCDYFALAVQAGVFHNGSVFRIVSREQRGNDDGCPIDVVQVGTKNGLCEDRSIVTHEHSALTHIHHRKWTASAARYAPGELYHSFFICLKDEPELDYGGNRQPDGQGFAAFGQVISGHEVVAAIFDRAESCDELARPIRIENITIKKPSGVNPCIKLG